jgi:hypothetical protein
MNLIDNVIRCHERYMLSYSIDLEIESLFFFVCIFAADISGAC